VEDWSRAGRFLLTHDTKTFSIIPLTGDSKPKALYSSSFVKNEFHLSPDGQLIAYGENRTGRWEVLVTSFPSFDHIKQVSLAGGAQPRWRGERTVPTTEQVTRSEQHSFLRGFQVECPATYKPSPNMETINRQTVGLRSQHLSFLVGDHDRSLHISSLIATGLPEFNR
jgi:hypothetical protein